MIFYCVHIDAGVPNWSDLEKAMVAVKIVVQGLVDFGQNHSLNKKALEQQVVAHKCIHLQTSHAIHGLRKDMCNMCKHGKGSNLHFYDLATRTCVWCTRSLRQDIPHPFREGNLILWEQNLFQGNEM